MVSKGKYTPEIRERAVRMVLEPEGRYGTRWGAVHSVAGQDRLWNAGRKGRATQAVTMESRTKNTPRCERSSKRACTVRGEVRSASTTRTMDGDGLA